MQASRQLKRIRRHHRIRAKVKGTAERPRLALYRSNRYIYGQLIDDEKSVTLAAIKSVGGNNMKASIAAGKKLSVLAKEKNIKKIVFDRGGFSYGGTIKAFADTLREEGLEF